MEQKDPKWALNEVLKVFCKTKVDVSNFFMKLQGRKSLKLSQTMVCFSENS